jgi:hypothetical protein
MQRRRSSATEIAFLEVRGKNGHMNALATPGAQGQSRRGRVSRWQQHCLALLLPILLGTCTHAAAQEPTPAAAQEPAPAAAQEPTPAVWQARDYSFPYRSSTNIFSCTALAGRVASIMRQLGARDDVKVRVGDCTESAIPPMTDISDPMNRSSSPTRVTTEFSRTRQTGPLQLANVRVHMMMPTEVTPEVLAELKKDKERRELISHVTGDPTIQFRDPVMFSAQWQQVTLSSKTIDLQPEECELIDQMSATIFRQAGLQVVRGIKNCSPGSRMAPELVLQALVATPATPLPAVPPTHP